MKRTLLLFALTAIVLASACTKTTIVEDPSGNGTENNNSNVVEISGEITTNTTWSANKIYLLKGFVFVTNAATLTIEPGTIIKGDKASKATLVITRGSKINATGTVDKPIVFTSALAAGARSQGDWGGVILLGKAPTNQGNDVKIEGGLVQPIGKEDKPYIYYGGTDATDNSGILKYVRIEFGGIAYSVDNEINGLTLGGVGNGTVLDYIQVYRSGDDAFEWFGGTVNAKHLLAIGTWDDDFDTDFGYSGQVQFALAQRVPTVADQSGSNGFESDNNATGTDATPKTSAVFSNITILGPIKATGGSYNANYQNGSQIRRNSSLSLFNSIVSGFPVGLYIDDTKVVTAGSTYANFISGNAVFQNNLFYGNKENIKISTTDTNAQLATLLQANNSFNSALFAGSVITNPYVYTTDFAANGAAGIANFNFLTGSAAETGALFTHAKLSNSFFTPVTYKGAFGSENWALGWATVDAQQLAYTTAGQVK